MYSSFTRYLSSKKSIDDRALNRLVWDSLHKNISEHNGTLHILEVGAGIGTMIERVVEWRLYDGDIMYTALDSFGENISEAKTRLPEWGRKNGYKVDNDSTIHLSKNEHHIEIRLVEEEFHSYTSRVNETCDLVIANAFLDLVNLDEALPALFGLLRDGGAFYFTINFDGMTLFEPVIDSLFDKKVEEAYHRTMDERITDEKQSGDSRTGRKMYHSLRGFGAEVTAAGASDWVVIPQGDVYPEDEAYFLHFIIETVHSALRASPVLDTGAFQGWIAERHAQIDRGDLVYIAHQIDYTGRYSASSEDNSSWQ